MQLQVVVEDLEAFVVDELAHAELPRGVPDRVDQWLRIVPGHAVAIRIDLQVGVAHQIQQHGPAIAIGWRLLGILRGKIF